MQSCISPIEGILGFLRNYKKEPLCKSVLLLSVSKDYMDEYCIIQMPTGCRLKGFCASLNPRFKKNSIDFNILLES